MSTKSRKTIASVAGVALVAITVFVIVRVAQAQDSGRPAVVRPGENTEGRFEIVMRDGVRADTFLLDTQEGRVWRLTQFTDVEGQPTVWNLMARIDSLENLLKLRKK